ncbi:MAG: DUF1858 domain-containing protein [Thermoplasmata archaeon]
MVKQQMISKEMGIAEVVKKYPETIYVFRKYGMGCIGCVAARYETIEAGASAHGINVDDLVRDINDVVSKEKEK